MSNPNPPAASGPYTRFEIELEFVQCLANPYYLNFLAQEKYLSDSSFLAYLNYLEYFRQPEYTKLLTYPKHSLNALSLLREQSFRVDIIQPHVAKQLFDDGVAGVTALAARNRDMAEGSDSGSGSGSGNGSALAGPGEDKVGQSDVQGASESETARKGDQAF